MVVEVSSYVADHICKCHRKTCVVKYDNMNSFSSSQETRGSTDRGKPSNEVRSGERRHLSNRCLSGPNSLAVERAFYLNPRHGLIIRARHSLIWTSHIVAAYPLQVGGFEVMRVLKSISEHSVKADVAYPDKADLAEMHIRADKSESAKPYRQHVAVNYVVDHTGRRIRAPNKQQQAEVWSQKQGSKHFPMMRKEAVVGDARRAENGECPRREGALRVEGMSQLS